MTRGSAPTEAFLARRGDEAIALPYGEELERSEERHGQADTVASFWRHTTRHRKRIEHFLRTVWGPPEPDVAADRSEVGLQRFIARHEVVNASPTGASG